MNFFKNLFRKHKTLDNYIAGTPEKEILGIRVSPLLVIKQPLTSFESPVRADLQYNLELTATKRTGEKITYIEPCFKRGKYDYEPWDTDAWDRNRIRVNLIAERRADEIRQKLSSIPVVFS